MTAGVSILTGNALVYYCYDVGTSINLEEVEKCVNAAERVPLSIERLSPGHIQFRKKPLLIRLGHIHVTDSLTLEATVKLYDFGAITIRLRVPISGDIKKLVGTCATFQNNKWIKQAADKEFRKISEKIEKLIYQPYEDDNYIQDYVIIHIEQFKRAIKGRELLKAHKETIARMLRCEKHELSKMELAEAIKTPLSYYADDLVVIDSNGTFLYAPRHTYDVHDVIEYAIIELLELRRYDAALDNALEQANKDLNERSFGLSPYSRTQSDLARVKLEVTEVMEKVENALKLIGDLYLTKVYNIAADRFGLGQWKSAVREKLRTAQGIYQILTDRLNARRLVILEIIVALGSALFVIEFIMNLMGK